jgi:hypothetical protein
MAKAKRKVGRSRAVRRSAEKSTLVRFSPEEYSLIERAIAHQTAGVVGGKAVTVAAFARHASIGVAQRIVHDAETQEGDAN